MDNTELQHPISTTEANRSRVVSPENMARLKRWSRRKPAIALMGEFSAGKSTILNFLLRKEFLPTQVTATQLPPVWISYGTDAPYVMLEDGRRKAVDLERLDEIPVKGTRFLRIFMEADILEAVDLIDTPGISDPKIPAEVWRRAVGYVNGVIWCTHATQAWRESERAAWVSLPERLRHNSLLLVTRSDKLGEKDRQKVLRRVNREAGSLFSKSILFSALDAIRARDHAAGGDLWAKSGGEKLIDAFFTIAADVIQTRENRVKRYKSDPDIKSGQKRPTNIKVYAADTEATYAHADVNNSAAEPSDALLLETPVSAKVPDVPVVAASPLRPRRVTKGDRPGRRMDGDSARQMREKLLDDAGQKAEGPVSNEAAASMANAEIEPLDGVSESTIAEQITEIANDLPEAAAPLLLETAVEDVAVEEHAPETDDGDFAVNFAGIMAQTSDMDAEETVAPEATSSDDTVANVDMTSLLQLMPDAMNENIAPEKNQDEAVSEEAGDKEQPQALTASSIWKAVLAQGRPQTMDELLETIELFLTEIDEKAIFSGGGDTPDGPPKPPAHDSSWHVL